MTEIYRGAGDADAIAKKAEKGELHFGISLGRRAPMHCMHADCILEIARAGLKPVIVIGSTNGPDSGLYDPVRNPLTVEQQKEQIRLALPELDFDDAHIITLPDEPDDNLWMRNLVQKIKEAGLYGKSVVHLRSKAADAAKTGDAIPPLSQYTQAFVNSGLSVWHSCNSNPEHDAINASDIRFYDLNALTMEQRRTLAAPGHVISLARKARDANPDKALLENLKIPLTALDLSFDRLYREAGIRTADILKAAESEKDKDMSPQGLARAAGAVLKKMQAEGLAGSVARRNRNGRKPLLVMGDSVSPETARFLEKSGQFDVASVSIGKFQSGEHFTELFYGAGKNAAAAAANAEKIRGARAVVVQSTAEPVGDHIQHLLEIVHTLKWHGAAEVTAVLPFAAYARQDRAFDGRLTSVASDMLARQLKAAGADRVVSFTFHSEASRKFFRDAFGNNFIPLSTGEIFASHLKGKFPFTSSQIVAGAPDGADKPHDEGQGRARELSGLLTGTFNEKAMFRIAKTHVAASETKILSFNGDVKGKDCVIVDDMVDGGSTLINAAKILKENGAKTVTCCFTHALLTKGTAATALERLMTARTGKDNGGAFAIDGLVMTDSVPEAAEKVAAFARHYPDLAHKIDIIPLGPAIARQLENLGLSGNSNSGNGVAAPGQKTAAPAPPARAPAR